MEKSENNEFQDETRLSNGTMVPKNPTSNSHLSTTGCYPTSYQDLLDTQEKFLSVEINRNKHELLNSDSVNRDLEELECTSDINIGFEPQTVNSETPSSVNCTMAKRHRKHSHQHSQDLHVDKENFQSPCELPIRKNKDQQPSELRNQIRESNPLDFLDEPMTLTAEMRDISTCTPSALVSLVENSAATGVKNLYVWIQAAERLTQIAEDLSFQDILRSLNSFMSINLVDKALWSACSLPLLRQMSKLRPLELVNTLELYENASIRPERLYISLLNALTKRASSGAMYGNEYALVAKTLAKLKLANSQILSELARSITKNLNMLTFNEGSLISASFRSLGVQSEQFYLLMDDRLQLETQMLTTQELLDSVRNLDNLEFVWKPHQDLIYKELRIRLAAFDSHRDVMELADPFETFDFLKHRGLLCKPFLLSLCQWCHVTAALTPTRSTKKPLNHQLLVLHDVMKEHGLANNENLQRAIKKFVLYESTGRAQNNPGPIRYKKQRGYYLAEDSFKQMNITVAKIAKPEEQLSKLEAKFESSLEPVVIPPGLSVPSYGSLNAMKEKPHIGALWSATITAPKQESSVNKTIRWTHRLPKNKEKIMPVPGYEKPAVKPIKYPGGWL